MQPDRRQERSKETHRAKRQKTSTGFVPTAKDIVAHDKQKPKPRAHANIYAGEGQYIATCAPSATISTQEMYQTASVNSPSRQFAHPTSLSVPVTTPYPPLQSRPNLQPLPMADLEPPREMGNAPEMNTFQGDFISAIDKAFFTSKVTLNPDEYMGASWVQNETSNLAVLNPVNVQEHNPVHNGAMNYPGNGNYPVTYDNSMPLNVYSNAQTMPSTPRPQEIPYISPTKDDFGYVPSITNMYPRYNAPNYLYDPMRNAMQPGVSDVMAFNGLLNAPASSFGMDGVASHDVQLNRLGIGAV